MYRQLRSIYSSLACRQFMDGLQQLEKECGYGEDRIPQLREVSAFLKGDGNLIIGINRCYYGLRIDRVVQCERCWTLKDNFEMKKWNLQKIFAFKR